MQEMTQKYRIKKSIDLGKHSIGGLCNMTKAELVFEIELLRDKMVNSFMEDDLENALELSQQLDQKIYRYVLITQDQKKKTPA